MHYIEVGFCTGQKLSITKHWQKIVGNREDHKEMREIKVEIKRKRDWFKK